MGKKRATLPKDFDQLVRNGDIEALKAVFDTCDINACGGVFKAPAISFYPVTEEFVRWLVENGADINCPDGSGATPLHHHAHMLGGHTDLLIELGADVNAVDQSLQTPLHRAAKGFKPIAVRSLVAHKSDLYAKEKYFRQNPFMSALASCKNANIEQMVEIAEIFLSAGMKIKPEMREEIKRIGKNFEFHRERFNKDCLDATDSALSRMYEMFGVASVSKRRIHDGISKITVSAKKWQDQFPELWEYLVPSAGHAKTMQGEVIRVAGRLSDEILGNGGCNWDSDYRAMLDALQKYMETGASLSIIERHEAKKLAKRMSNGSGSDEPVKLCKLAVSWVLKNPNPIPLEKPDYKR